MLEAFLAGSVITLVVVVLQDLFFRNKKDLLREKQMLDLSKLVIDNKNDIHSAFKAISSVNKSQEKFIGMVKDTAQTIESLYQGQEKLVEMSDVTTKALADLLRRHNVLADIVFDGFQEVYCDLYDGDCSCCPYQDDCKEYKKEPTPMEPSNDSCVASMEPSILQGAVYTSQLPHKVINPNNPEEVKELESLFQNHLGISAEISAKAISDLLKISKERNVDKVVISWLSSGPAPKVFLNYDSNTKPDSKQKDKKDQLVDPKSKIVKTLNNLFDRS